MDGLDYTLEQTHDISAISANDWNRLAGDGNPFVQHEFLKAMETGGAVGNDSGWEPLHLLLRDSEGSLLGAVPHYIKHHSYGEYIFDHSWADGFMRAGGQYYPKLLGAVPFTPATGPRLLARDNRDDIKAALAYGITQLIDKYSLSSAHLNFLPEEDLAPLRKAGWLIRSGLQFHWQNNGYKDFDDFLSGLSSRKRKNIRKERQSVHDAGVRMMQLTGSDITRTHIDTFFRFYISTIDRKWGGAYLTHDVFRDLHRTMPDKIMLVLAEYEGRIIAGAINFIGDDCLYGRNWGADLDIPNLHFEACYYQAIDFAIQHGLARVEAGAQGFHKVQRGYLPVKTYSAHWIAHDGFKDAIARFLSAESRGIEAEKNHIDFVSPFRKDV